MNDDSHRASVRGHITRLLLPSDVDPSALPLVASRALRAFAKARELDADKLVVVSDL